MNIVFIFDGIEIFFATYGGPQFLKQETGRGISCNHCERNIFTVGTQIVASNNWIQILKYIQINKKDYSYKICIKLKIMDTPIKAHGLL